MIVYRVLDAVRSFCKEACALGQAPPETGLMTGTNTKLAAAVEAYFADLGRVRASGGATGERSSYGPLANLLNAVGATLKPKVFCGGEYAYPLTERLGIRAGGDASRREYEGSTFDRTFVGLHLGPRWLIGAASEVSLLAEVSRQWHSGNPDSDTFGGRIEAERRLGPRWRLDASAAWRKRDYRRHDYLDGPAREVSLGASWVATPTLRLWATLGHDRDRPKTKQWRSAALWGRRGASFVLPRGFTLGASGALRRTAYEGGDGGWPHYTDDGTRRTDMTRTLRVSVLNRGLTFAGFSPRLTLVDEMRTTNAQLQDYKRNRAELGFVKQF